MNLFIERDISVVNRIFTRKGLQVKEMNLGTTKANCVFVQRDGGNLKSCEEALSLTAMVIFYVHGGGFHSMIHTYTHTM